MKERSVFTNFRFWGFVGFFLIFLVPLGYHLGLPSFLFALGTFLEVVLLFNILIIVHELGHFLAARWCGLKVDKFAIWFGKALWSRKVDGVEYILGSIPAGGYVALPQMAPMEAIEGKTETPKEDLPPASPGHKIIVAFAGPLFSFGLALVFACIVWAVGKPVTYSEKTTVIGYVKTGGPADLAGLKPGDEVQSIDGHPVSKFFGNSESIVWRVISSTEPKIGVVVRRDGVEQSFEVVPDLVNAELKKAHFWQRAPLRHLMIGPAVKELVVDKVIANSPAAMAGIQQGDRFLALNSAKLYSDATIYQQIEDHPKEALNFTVERKGATLNLGMVPEVPIAPKGVKDPMLGIDWTDPAIELVYPTPWQQVSDSVSAITDTVSVLFASNSHVGASQLSGPLGIMRIFFLALSGLDGWRYALWLAVLINVNLAILNLLPFPILDGGHILLSIIEWLRRRPLSMVILEPLQTVFALILIGYMAYITFFDIQDAGKMALNMGGGGEIKFAPKPGSP